MARQIIVGRDGNQPFKIPDSMVSTYHAKLYVSDDGQIQLIDTNSTNGTFIFNGREFVKLYPNQPYKVSPDTMLRLGPHTQFHVRKLLSNQVNAGAKNGVQVSQPSNPKPAGAEKPKPKKKIDISHLRKVSENYETTKLKLESKSGMINGLRSFTIIISLAAGLGGTMIKGGNDDTQTAIIAGVISFGIAILLMVVLLIIINNFNKSLMQKRRDNDHNYAVKYVCPECKVSFRGKIYENILAERCCPRCKTEYYEKESK